MNHDVLREKLVEAAQQVLEEAAFLFTDLAEGTPEDIMWEGTVVQAWLPFSGPVSGRFMLASSLALGGSLAADLLGLEPGDTEALEKVEDALGELLNMMAGLTLEQLLSPLGCWELGVPEVKRMPAGRYVCQQSHAQAWARLDTDEEEALELAVFLSSEGGES